MLLNHSRSYRNYTWAFDKIIAWTFIGIFLSVIPASVDYNQSLVRTLALTVRPAYVFLLYFVLRKLNIGNRFLLRLIIGVSLIWVALELGQQFTYPQYWFAGRGKLDGNIEERMGLYRYYIWGVDFVMLAFAYVMDKALSKKHSIVDTVSFLALFAGLMCYCSRKHIYATLLALAISLFWSNKKKNKALKFVIVAVCVVVVSSYINDFMEMNREANAAQGEGDDFVRWLALGYYLTEFSNSVLFPIFGTGLPDTAANSLLASKIDFCENILRFYRSDIGVFGYYATYGLAGVSAVVWYIIRFVQHWRLIDTWLKVFFIMKLLLIVFDFWGMWTVGNMAFVCFVYLLEMNIQKNKGQRRLSYA